MPCTISGSFPIDCARVAGGLSECKIKILPNDTTAAGGYTTSSGSITMSSPATTGWYTFGLEQQTASFNFDPQTNRQNGSAFYNHTFKLILNKLRASANNELTTLAQARLQIAVKTQEGSSFLLGLTNGMMLEPSIAGSGTAMGDRNGYELNFASAEPQPAYAITNYSSLVT